MPSFLIKIINHSADFQCHCLVYHGPKLKIELIYKTVEQQADNCTNNTITTKYTIKNNPVHS